MAVAFAAKAALCMAAGLLVTPSAGGAQARPIPPRPAVPTCSISALPGLSVQYARALRQTRFADFWLVAESILRSNVSPPLRTDLPCDDGVRSRDRVAWSMSLGGYSAREIADVLGGHLTRADIDEAMALLMAGQPRPLVSAFLEARWRDAMPTTTASAAPTRPGPDVRLMADFDADLSALARQHHLAPDLVRAIVAAESGWNPRAVSPAGAIGLMQLMPSTAAALGVDPWKPVENLRGGIAYLASLMRAYGGNARLALIAYNAGPQHADRVRAGRAVAYRETRRYLDAVAARYPLP